MPIPLSDDNVGADAGWTVLCVDDEPNILSALRRSLRPEGCRVLTAGSGAEALGLLAQQPVDVVVSDMRMPGMDGAALLARVRQDWPDAGRVLLTGYADINDTVTAINEGQIYRYIHKPWDDAELRLTVRHAAERRALELERQRLQALTTQQNAALQALNAELEQRVEARTAELRQANDQLKRNYLTSIKVFSNLMELRGGIGTGHGKRTGDLARRTAIAMARPADEVQDILVAGLLHDIGFMALPDTVLNKPVGRMGSEELKLYKRHPIVGAQSFMALDAHQAVATAIRSHHERFDGTGFPDGLADAQIPLSARILAVASTYDDLMRGHVTGMQLTADEAATLVQRGRGTQFDPEVVDVFLHILQQERHKPAAAPPLDTTQLRPGMVLGKDWQSREGVLLLSAGQRLTEDMIRRIRRYEAMERTTLHLEVKPPPAGQA